MPLSTCVYKFNHFFIFFCSEMNRNNVPETGKSHDREHREIRMHGPKIEYAFGVRCSRVNSFSHIFALNLTYDIIINSPGSDLELCATVQYARFLSTTRIHFTWNANSDTHFTIDRFRRKYHIFVSEMKITCCLRMHFRMCAMDNLSNSPCTRNLCSKQFSFENISQMCQMKSEKKRRI